MATSSEMKTYKGSCHCGRVRFEIRTELTRVSECNCSICRRKGYLHHMVTPDRFRLIQGGGRSCDVSVRHQARASPLLPPLRRRCFLSSAGESLQLHGQRPLP